MMDGVCQQGPDSGTSLNLTFDPNMSGQTFTEQTSCAEEKHR